jgi:20S proteasome subunit beta 7
VILENGWHSEISEEEAKKLLSTCMTIMFYRDKKASDKVQFTVITQEGVKMEEPIQVDSNWDLSFYKEKTNEFWRPMRILI